MVRPFFSALAIILLFPRLCEGYLPLCPGGNLHKEAIEEKILKPVNHRRQGLIEGWQQNGKTGKNLPPATDMTKLRWSCELERVANDAISMTCGSQPQIRGNSKGLAEFSHWASIHKFYYPSGDILGNVIQSYLLQINLHHLDVDADAHNVYYNGDEQLKTYANLVRSTNTEIGCAIKGCDNPANDPDLGEVVMCCVLNSRGVKWQCIHIERSIDRVMLGLTHLTHVRARIRRSILHQQSKIRDAAVYAIMSRIG
ncbi:hypothetical protein Y032_0004g1768 [Ancylostoma ceylanicum]|uniref:SCP domain-containing protein n=1 Tax=Ancylostoma ceylanicum TaxID=53326 RepID=A0A016VUQ4_9BILA|nr:hypothetical protein Y032_0004g1768 [Ancylostoma ceylanicum]